MSKKKTVVDLKKAVRASLRKYPKEKLIAYALIYEDEKGALLDGVMPKEINELLSLMVNGILLQEEYDILKVMNSYGLARMKEVRDRSDKAKEVPQEVVEEDNSEPTSEQQEAVLKVEKE